MLYINPVVFFNNRDGGIEKSNIVFDILYDSQDN